MVEACKWVDELAWGTPYAPSIKTLDDLNCDFAIHGDDMATSASGEDAYAEVKNAGRLRTIKRTEGISTTDIVGRLLLMTKQHHVPSSTVEALSTNAAANAKARNSPSVVALSADLTPPPLDLCSPTAAGGNATVLPAAAPTASASGGSTSSDATATAVASPAPSAAASPCIVHARRSSGGAGSEYKHHTKGMQTFLPTTWRISAFSNRRTPSKDDVVVYVDGAFDLFHVGHVETLAKAKAMGTFLYVGVHDDATVNQHKGRNYPIMNLLERVMNVLSTKYCDEVVIGAPWTVTKDLITSLGIHIVASGSNSKVDLDYARGSSDPYEAAKKMGIFREIESTHTLQTDDVVKRIIDNRLKYEERNKNRGAKEASYLAQKEFVAEV